MKAWVAFDTSLSCSFKFCNSFVVIIVPEVAEAPDALSLSEAFLQRDSAFSINTANKLRS
jgi:hypothetical protein